MKFVITASDLKQALAACNDVVPSSSSVADERSGVLIAANAETNSVVFSAADENLFIRREIPVIKVESSGEALVRCNSVLANVSATFNLDFGWDDTPTEITLETTENSTLKITGGNRVREGKTQTHKRNFPLLNTGLAVVVPTFVAKKATKFPIFHFLDGLTRTQHAAAKEPAKQSFNCINLTLTDDEVVFTATDTLQIAEFRKAAEVKGLRGSFTLGLKFANIAAKLVNPGEAKFVDLYVENNQIFTQFGHTTLVGNLLSSSFPDCSPYFQTQDRLLATFPREDFAGILGTILPSVDAKSHRMEIVAQKTGTATLSTSSVSGEAESSDLDVETPEDFILHFNSTLLQSAVRQVKGDTLEMYFTQDAKGVLLKSSKDEDFKAFVCTLRRVE